MEDIVISYEGISGLDDQDNEYVREFAASYARSSVNRIRAEVEEALLIPLDYGWERSIAKVIEDLYP